MKKIISLCSLLACVSLMTAQVTFTNEAVDAVGTNRAAVDMNGDTLDDLVSISSSNVNVFYQQVGGGFSEVNIPTPAADNSPSWSMAAADYDANGFTDLLYGGGSGVTFMRANDSGTAFTEDSFDEYVFSQRTNFVDINNDGHLDAFVCHDVEPNVYFLNDGSGNLTFYQGGLGDFSSGGNYGSVWIDYDNDGDMDMFIAKCGGSTERRTNQMHTNNEGVFEENALDLGLADSMQTWSSAWGDYDNDGDMDVFVGASTGAHKLMRNNGDSTFTDVTAGSSVTNVSETGIENCTYDIDNDGNLDIVSNGNILYGNGDLTFDYIDYNALHSGSFGDLNSDGFVDEFSNNQIFWNDGNSNNWITITTKGVESNINGIGARIEVVTTSGMQIRDVRSGEGFRFASTLNTHVGIGDETEITTITVHWPSGIVDVYENPTINQTIIVTEGETELGVNDSYVDDLISYPNPTTEMLNLSITEGYENAIYSIYDMNGRRVLNGKLNATSINVSKLSAGNYILRLVNDGSTKFQKFIKK